MAQVTMELRALLEMTNFDLFDFDYKCDFPDWKETLERDIKAAYYFHEIGQETPDRFKHYFQATLQRIMPYYNDLYASTLLGDNPLINYRMTEETEGTTTTESESTADTESTSTGTGAKTDYPQTGDPAEDIPTEKTTAEDWNSTSAAQTRTDTARNDQRKVIEGMTGTSYAKLLQEHRESLLRITDRIIKELRPCFILVY